MAQDDKCPPHDWRTTSITTDQNGVITSATQICNKCGNTRHIRA